MTTIIELKQLRTVLRSGATRLMNKFRELEQERSTNTNDNNQRQSIDQYSAILVQLEAKQQRLSEIDSQILPIVAADIDLDSEDGIPPPIEAEIHETENRQLAISTCISKLRYVVGVLEASDRPNISSHNSEITQLCDAIRDLVDRPIVHPTPRTARLPEINLPRFDGDPMKFKSFWESFNATVDKQLDLEPCVKLTHLLSLLDGEAKAAFEGTIPTNQLYDDIRQKLEERFGREQLVTLTHLRSLFRMPRSTDSAHKLRSMLNNFQIHMRYLSTIEIDDWMDLIFIALLLEKIPTEVEANITRQQGMKDWDYKTLSEMIEIEIRAREKPKTHDELGRQHSSALRKSTVCIISGNDHEQKQFCVFCRLKNHESKNCKKFTDANTRKEVLKKGNRCFACLGNGHSVTSCKKRAACSYCSHTHHHPSICYKRYGKSRPEEGRGNDNPTAHENDNVLIASDEGVFMPSAWVEIKNPSSNKSVFGRAIIDTGSHRTKITEAKARELGLKPVDYVALQIGTFGTDKYTTFQVPVVELTLLGRKGQLIETRAHVFSVLTGKISRPGISLDKYPLLKEISLADPPHSTSSDMTIEVIIGSNLVNKVYGGSSSIILDQSLGLALHESVFGWVMSGPTRQETDDKAATHSALLTIDSPLATDFHPESFWSLEAIGITDSATKNDNDEAIDQFNSSICFDEGRYNVRFPWRINGPELPENYELAKGRLRSLWNRLSNDKSLMQTYDDVIKDQEERGIIESVPTQLRHEGENIHYIPHHGVKRENSGTTKLRIVYDASAKTKKTNPCLNEALYSGPLLLRDMCGILIRFRLSPIAIISDIEKAFLSIGLQMPDRDSTRFLWLNDCNMPPSDDNLRILRFTRIPFGTISSPFLLNATITHHLNSSTCDSVVAREIKENIYVDNVVVGKKTATDAMQFYHEAKSLFNQAGMNLREWGSNCSEFCERIPESDQSQDCLQKVLGLRWNTKTDEIFIPQTDLTILSSFTKRAILKATARIFDPLGLFVPVTVRGKLLFRRASEEGKTWDDVLPNHLKLEWDTLISDLHEISSFYIPRYIGIDDYENVELHCFCDASGDVYATCAYIRYWRKNDAKTAKTSLIFAKTRLSPSGSISIPRLELLGVLIGTRLIKFLLNEIPFRFSRTTIWSDSQCVLHWIQSKRLRSIFVENRLKEIRDVPNVEFRYVQTSDNPADLPTRGVAISDLKENSKWWHGPEWLQKDESEWPEIWINNTRNEEEKEERKRKTEIVSALAAPEVHSPFDLNLKDYCSLGEALQETAEHLLREKQIDNAPTANDLAEARCLWEVSTQNTKFRDLLTAVQKGLKNQTVSKLRLFIDETGLLRSKGRIDNVHDLPYDAKFPILLPNDDLFTKMVIKECHERCGHSGTSHTLVELRQRYWIIAGRREVSKVLKECSTCRKWEGGPYLPPDFPPLPKERVNGESPFTTVGADFLGPLFIKVDNYNDSDQTRKVWVCLLTCATTRAIHLEIVNDLTASEFLNSLRKFIARRGVPRLIISDNAKTFKLSNKSQLSLWNDKEEEKVKQQTAEKGINWKFITEKSPWMGGFYERLVKSVKMALKKMADGSLLSYRQLDVLLTEIEGILNSRPLTYVGGDIRDGHPLSPNDMLGIHNKTFLPQLQRNIDQDHDMRGHYSPSAQSLIHLWRHRESLLQEFWSRWRRDYLTSLRERAETRNRTRGFAQSPPKTGDKVLIIESGLPRGHWRIGKIQSLVPSRGETIRAAKVLLDNGRTLIRPIKLLTPFEFAEERDTIRASKV